MSDLISRQGAIMHFVKASKNYECGIFSLDEVTHELWEIPSAERKGKWIETYEDDRKQIFWWECSECKYGISWKANFCPNCGARMEGSE